MELVIPKAEAAQAYAFYLGPKLYYTLLDGKGCIPPPAPPTTTNMAATAAAAAAAAAASGLRAAPAPAERRGLYPMPAPMSQPVAAGVASTAQLEPTLGPQVDGVVTTATGQAAGAKSEGGASGMAATAPVATQQHVPAHHTRPHPQRAAAVSDAGAVSGLVAAEGPAIPVLPLPLLVPIEVASGPAVKPAAGSRGLLMDTAQAVEVGCAVQQGCCALPRCLRSSSHISTASFHDAHCCCPRSVEPQPQPLPTFSCTRPTWSQAMQRLK